MRGIGWGSVSKSFKRRFFYVPAVSVSFGGLLFLSILLGAGTLQLAEEAVKLLVIIWIVYSITELVGYALLSRLSKIFLGSLSSAIGILIMFAFLVAPISRIDEIFFPYIIYSVPFLLISAVASAIGFIKLHGPVYLAESSQGLSITPSSNVLFCPNCGKQIPAESKFCPYCGQTLIGV